MYDVWEGRGAEIGAVQWFYKLDLDVGRMVVSVILRPIFASFRHRHHTPSSCRRHDERATPRKLTFEEKLAVALIQQLDRSVVCHMTNAPTFSASRAPNVPDNQRKTPRRTTFCNLK